VRRRRHARFVGRRAELAELSETWSEVCLGQAAGIVISGEAGVGKSRLISECLEPILAGDGQVLFGSCVRVGTGGLPYGPILDALRRLLQDRDAGSLDELFGAGYAELDRLLHVEDEDIVSPTPAGRASGIRQGQLFERFLALLAKLALDAPLVFVIEDIHWAEQSTLDLLGFLTVALRTERVLLVVTYRDDEPSHGPLPSALLELFRSTFMTRISLQPFDRPDLTELLEQLAGAPLWPGAVERIADLSGGNAFFAEELLSAQGIDPQGPVPAQVRDVVLLRIAGLSRDAQDLVRRAAVVGRRVSHPLLAAVSDLPDGALLTALRELVAGHLLVADTDGGYRFRHALTQEAAYSDLLPGERATLHGLVATALSDQPHLREGPRSTTTAVIAHHAQAAGDPSKALSAVVAAGRAAAEVHGYSEGYQYFRRALTLWDEVPDPGTAGIERPDLLAAAAKCAHYADHDDEAVELVEQALVASPSEDVVRRALMHEALGSYLSRANGARALDALTEAYRLLAGSDATAERARVTASLAQALSIRGRYADSAPFWDETLALARDAGCRREEVLGLRTSGWHLAMHGEPELGIARMRDALRVAAAEGDLEGVSVTYNHLSLALDFVGRSAECLTTVEEALRWSADAGVFFTPMIDMLDSIVLVLFRLGRWREAEEIASRLYASHGAARGIMTAVVSAELATARGDTEQAEQRLKQAREMLEGDDDPLNHGLAHGAAATRDLWLGEHRSARAEVRRGLEIVAARGDDQQAVALCALGLRVEADEAERRSARGAPEAGDDSGPYAAALRARARSLWRRMGTRQVSFPEAAVEAATAEAEFARFTGGARSGAWADIADGWERLARPYPAAYARWREAEALVAARDVRAAEVLRRAAAVTRDLDARALGAEIVALALRARIDLGVPDAVPAPVPYNPFALTERELQVLGLLKVGRRNREIARTLYISESTASVHVSNILTKLDAKNRGEAAAVAHRLGLGEPVPEDRTGPRR
jgi:DNA-binding CsgD family transcriptional regulator/tetratricopeptide (TPR) repeat protein